DSRPDAVQRVHEGFLAVGCDAVETNTFGGSLITLGEFGLSARTRELNRRAAEIARAACDKYASKDSPRFVVGSVSPGTKLPTLGHVEPRAMLASFTEQAYGLLDG